MSDLMKSKDPCPTCLMQNKALNYLRSRPGMIDCPVGHKFDDTEELNLMRAQAMSRYPQYYQSNVPAPADPSALASQDIVITPEVRVAMEQIVGHPITSGADIKGSLYAHVQDNKEKDQEIRAVRATLATMQKRAKSIAGPGPALDVNQIIVTIPEWAMEGVRGQAEYQGKSIEEWTAENVEAFWENYFGAPVHQS